VGVTNGEPTEWTNGVPATLPDPGASSSTYADAVNDAHVAVGELTDHPTRWVAQGQPERLPNPPGKASDDASYVTGVSTPDSSGRYAISGSTLRGGGTETGLIWTTDLTGAPPTPVPVDATRPAHLYGLDPSGLRVVGMADAGPRAALWRFTNNWTSPPSYLDLTTYAAGLPNGSNWSTLNRARAIDANGNVVGGNVVGEGQLRRSHEFHAFLLTGL